MNSDSPEKTSRAASERAKKAMRETLDLVKSMGRGAAGLVKRLTGSKTPREMMDELDKQVGENKALRAGCSRKLEDLHSLIARKKKEHATAGAAKQRVLEMELRSLLTEYKSAERTLGILLENERNLSLVRGRLDEVMAYGISGVNEDLIDDVTDRIEDAAEEAEGRVDAARDLERAGKRRHREEDTEDLWAALGEFDTAETGEAEPDTASPEPAAGERKPAASRPEPKGEPEPER